MQLVFKQGDGAEKRWDFEPDRLINAEAIEIEKRTGLTFAEWAEKMGKGSMLAIHAFLFVMLRREVHSLKWDDVVFSLSQIDFEVSDEEASKLRASLEAAERDGTINDAGRARLEQLVADGVPLPDDDEPDPKA